jgi:uncharacterized protein
MVLTEFDHLAKARFGLVARGALVSATIKPIQSGRFQLPHVDPEMLATAQTVQQQYAALDLDIADAVNVAVAAAYVTDVILTLDRGDFRVIRPLTTHSAFRLLPDDG